MTLGLLAIISLLIQTGIFTIGHPLLAAIVTVLLLFGLPGFLIIAIFLPGTKLTVVEKLPTAFTLGIGLLSLPATFFLILKLSLTPLIYLSLLINLSLIGWYVFRARPDHNARKTTWSSFLISSKMPLSTLILYLLFLLFIGLMLTFFITTPVLSAHSDRWTYLAYIRKYLSTATLDATNTLYPLSDARMAFSGWLVLQALISRVAGVDPVDAHSLLLPPFWALLSILSFYTFAKVLFKNEVVALFAAAIKMIFWATTLIPHGSIVKEEGFSLFMRINEDKTMVWLLLLPVTLALFIHQYRLGHFKGIVPLILAAIATALTHPLGLIWLGLAVGSFVALNILLALITKVGEPASVKTVGPEPPASLLAWRYNLKNKPLLIIIPILLVMVGLIPLLARQTLQAVGISGLAAPLTETTYNYQRLAEHHLYVFDLDTYMAAPSLISHPLTILALLLTPFLLFKLREQMAARFLFSTMVFPLLLIYNPWTTPLLGSIITPWMLWRIPRVLPVALVIGFVLYDLAEKLPPLLPLSQRWKQVSTLTPTLLVVILMGLVALFYGDIKQGVIYTQGQQRHETLRSDERAMLEQLAAIIPANSIILADPTVSKHIPAFIAGGKTLTFRDWTVDKTALEQTEQFYRVQVVNSFIIDTLNHYKVDYVIFENGSPLAMQLKYLPAMFSPIFQDKTYLVFARQPNLAQNQLILANDELTTNNWSSAIDGYEQLLAEDPHNLLAHLGLGQAYQASQVQAMALSHLQKVIELEPSLAWPRLYQAETYLAAGDNQTAAKLLREVLDSQADNHPIREEVLKISLNVADLNNTPLPAKLSDAYQAAITREPDNLELYQSLARLYQAVDQPDQVIASYRQALKHWPAWTEAHVRLGQTYAAQGQKSEAIEQYQTAIRLNPELTSPYQLLADLYQTTGETAEVETILRSAARNNPTAAWPWVKMGQLHLPQTPNEAIPDLQRAVNLAPHAPEPTNLLSRAYSLTGQPEQQLALYQQAMAVNPDLAWPRVGLAEVYLEQGQVETAIAEFNQAIQLERTSKEPYLALGQAYVNQQLFAKAINTYDRARRRNPAQAWPHLELGDIHLAIGDLDSAMGYYQQALALEPDSADALIKIGSVYFWQRNQPEIGLDYFRRATLSAPDRAWGYIILGTALFHLGDDTNGAKNLEQALRLEPESSLIQRAVGTTMLQYRSAEVARPFLETAAARDPNDVWTYLSLAQLHRQLADYPQALAYSQQALELAQDPHTLGTIYAEQGVIYQQQNELDQALESFLLAVEKEPTNAWFQAAAGNFYLHQLQQGGMAVRYYRQAVRLAPENGWYYLGLGTALLRAGHNEEGLDRLEQALDLARGQTALYLELGRLASSNQRWEQVIQIYEQAVAQGINDADIYIQLGNAYQLVKEPDKAIESYQRAAKLAPNHPDLPPELRNFS